MCWILSRSSLQISMLLGAFTNTTYAQDPLQQHRDTIRIITHAANEVCSKVETIGSTSDYELSGEAKATVNIVLKRLADVGVRGSGTIRGSEYENVLQKDLAGVLKSNMDCKREVFNTLAATLLPKTPTPTPPPPPPNYVNGWTVEISGQGAGGGNFAPVSVTPFVAKIPAAIDAAPHLPPGTSPRNTYLALKASTTHRVTAAGTWLYQFQFATRSFAQCQPLDFRSDGVPARAPGLALSGIPASGHPSTDLRPVTFSVEQDIGKHELTVGLRCYVLGAEFPVISVTVQDPSRTPFRRPVDGEFTTPEIEG
jgi:hypothetical protein